MSDSLDDVAFGYNPGFMSWANEVQEALIASGQVDKIERWPRPQLPLSERGSPSEGSTQPWSCDHGNIVAGYTDRPYDLVMLEFSVPGSGESDKMDARTRFFPMTPRGALDAARLMEQFAKTGFESFQGE